MPEPQPWAGAKLAHGSRAQPGTQLLLPNGIACPLLANGLCRDDFDLYRSGGSGHVQNHGF
eukprot:1080080-Alexandrium_andersonii.AAC.1